MYRYKYEDEDTNASIRRIEVRNTQESFQDCSESSGGEDEYENKDEDAMLISNGLGIKYNPLILRLNNDTEESFEEYSESSEVEDEDAMLQSNGLGIDHNPLILRFDSNTQECFEECSESSEGEDEDTMHPFDGIRFRKLALRFDDDRQECFEEYSESSEESLGVAGETNRITTRARQTYELYRYNKNAMLILSQLDDREDAKDLIGRLKTTFEEFSFEVEVYFASSPGDLYEKCRQFFQKDFHDYGAVALAIVTSMSVNQSKKGVYRPDGMFYNEFFIVQNFETGRNLTLASKPKIYITLDDRAYGRNACIPPLARETHSDVLALHAPLRAADLIGADFGAVGVYNSKLKRKFRNGGPIDLLCAKITVKWDNEDMATIMRETAEEYARSDVKRSHLRQIPVQVTLDKQLYLVRRDVNNYNDITAVTAVTAISFLLLGTSLRSRSSSHHRFWRRSLLLNILAFSTVIITLLLV